MFRLQSWEVCRPVSSATQKLPGLVTTLTPQQQTPDKIQNISSKKQTKTAVTALLTLEI